MTPAPREVPARHWYRDPKVWNAVAMVGVGLTTYIAQSELPHPFVAYATMVLNGACILANAVLLIFFNQSSTLPPNYKAPGPNSPAIRRRASGSCR